MEHDRLLPDFFVLGAAKCGTTSLHHYLREHPDLYLPYVKELGFFKTPDAHFQSGLEDYLSYFEGASASLTGEATPGYFREVDLVAPRMRELYADRSPPMFVLIFRDPVERAFSHYLHRVRGGSEERTFEEALAAERKHPEESRKSWESYFGDGVYADTLEKWFEQFPEDRFLVALTRDLADDSRAVMERVFRFLGVPLDVPVETDQRKNAAGPLRSTAVRNFIVHPPDWLRHLVKTLLPSRQWRRRVRYFIRRLNTGKYENRPSLDPSLASALRERYRPHIHRLETMIDRDLSAWYES